MITWSHISDIPEDLRKDLFAVECRHRAAEEKLIEALAATVREKRLVERVPDLVECAIAWGLSVSQAVETVSLVTGLSFSHCERLYYARRNR